MTTRLNQCAQCGADYLAHREHSTFCSPRCRAIAWRTARDAEHEHAIAIAREALAALGGRS